MLRGRSSSPSLSGWEGIPTAMPVAKPFCLLKIGKAGARRAKIPAEAGMPRSWGSHCSGWSFCKVPGELLLTHCSGRRPASQPLEQAFAPACRARGALPDFATRARALLLLQQKPLAAGPGPAAELRWGASSCFPSSAALPMLGFSCAWSNRGPSRRHGCKTGWQVGSRGGRGGAGAGISS